MNEKRNPELPFSSPVIIKGGGDLATGVAVRLWRAGFQVVITELAQPLAIRRSVAFAEAVFSGETIVEGITARRTATVEEIVSTLANLAVPVVPEPNPDLLIELRPGVFVDATMRKVKAGPKTGNSQWADAKLVIGLGPGFMAGEDVDAVIETNRGHFLGRVFWEGSAQADTGVPGLIKGVSGQRVIHANTGGVFQAKKQIGDQMLAGEIIGWIGECPVVAPIDGVLRGIIHPGIALQPGVKIGDIDPRGMVEHCFTVSEKALAVGGGVLEAILAFFFAGERIQGRI